MYSAFNLRGSSVYANLATDIAFSASRLELWNPSTDSIHVEATPADKTVTVSGFSPYSTVHLYYIWGSGPGLSMIASTSPPPAGPTFPSGYTNYCHAGAVRLNAHGKLNRMEIRGKRHFFQNNAYWPPFVLDPSNPRWPQRSLTPQPPDLSVVNDPVYYDVAVVINASRLDLIRPSDGDIHTINSPASQQVKVNNGPYPEWRDQAAPFYAGTDIHFYWIWGATPGLSCISSNGPPDVGPILPSGYTHWQYAQSTKCLTDDHIPSPRVIPYIEQPTGQWNSCDLAYAIPDYCETVDMFMDAQLVTNTGRCQSALYLSLEPDPAQFDAVYAIYSCPVEYGGVVSFFPANCQQTIPAPKVVSGKMNFSYRWADMSNPSNILHRWFCMYLQGYTVP